MPDSGPSVSRGDGAAPAREAGTHESSIAPGTYGIDTTHSQVGFAVRHLGISSVRGTFDRCSGALFVGNARADTVVTIEAEMASINSA